MEATDKAMFLSKDLLSVIVQKKIKLNFLEKQYSWKSILCQPEEILLSPDSRINNKCQLKYSESISQSLNLAVFLVNEKGTKTNWGVWNF